ncbi:hypothetical protein H4R33_005053 [Dimargaris cristalligena]|nr:hypothetical protein H4R33_005053 [Dimargaris cristalligena]
MDAREEITTIFVVGFPEDMQEREFQNMFTFYPDFEAATLKIPMSGSTSDGEEPAASSAVRKQIIGFAKFRTRAAAQEARNILTGRKVDAEKNCILKAEMAKKNLHTKRGLASNGAGVAVPLHLNHDTLPLDSPTTYLFPNITTATANHLSKRFDPFCTSAPVTPISGTHHANSLGSSGSGEAPTAADFFPSHDAGVFDFYADGMAGLDNPASFLQRRNSVHHTMLREASPALGTSAPATRAVGFGLAKTQSERRNTNPASLAHINQLFGTSSGSTNSLVNKNLDLGGLGGRLSNLSLGPSTPGVSLPAAPISMSLSKSSAGFPASSSVPNGFAIPLTRSVNSNDQNPPCNTLYVGNLPMNTAEEELRGLFTQALGYKRLCFRPKPNAGPICFVEFEDVAYATQAMRELDGHPISSSTNGGIRLSFSKNPLGVRQATPTNTTSLNMMGSLPVLGGSYPLNLAALKAASHTPPPSASSLFGSSLGSRHAPGLDHSLGLEPTSAAIH